MSFHHRPLLSPCLLALPKSSSALQVLGHCFLPSLGDGAKGSQAYRKAQCLLSSKKGTRFIRRGPQAKTQSKTAPARLGESKITPRLKHNTWSSRNTRAVKSQRATGSSSLTAPVRNAGGHSPACHLHYPTRGRQPPVPRKARPRGRMLPGPNRICFTQRAGASHVQGDTSFACDCGHRCGELA